MDPTFGAVARPVVGVPAQVAVVAEREAAGRIVERLRVGRLERRELRWPPEMDEEARGLVCAERRGSGIVAERPDVAMAAEPVVVRQPGGAPPEPGDPVPLELLGERPELVEPERLRRSGDEVLAHGGDDTRGGWSQPGYGRRIVASYSGK